MAPSRRFFAVCFVVWITITTLAKAQNVTESPGNFTIPVPGNFTTPVPGNVTMTTPIPPVTQVSVRLYKWNDLICISS